MLKSARVLLADLPAGLNLLLPAFDDSIDCLPVSRLKDAQAQIELRNDGGGAPLDLVVCGLHFDDFQMLTLLSFARSAERTAPIPFLPVQMLRRKTPVRDDVIRAAILALGGFPLLRVDGMSADVAQQTVLSEILKIIRGIKESL